jgi:hypothetical protein
VGADYLWLTGELKVGLYSNVAVEARAERLSGGGPIAPFGQINSIGGESQAKKHDSHANDCYRSDHVSLLSTGVWLAAKLVDAYANPGLDRLPI